jgi:Phosphatidylethanolamine-binding protein
MTYLDVPHYGSTVTLLHWVEPDLTLLPSLVLTKTPLNSTRGAPDIGPAPPPGDPHQYTLLLFSQPSGFAVPDSFSGINPPADTSTYIGFSITEFTAAATLDTPLAGTHFGVVNTSGTTSGTGSPAQSSPVQYEG